MSIFRYDLTKFKPHHIDAHAEDFLGNHNLGRYIFLCGSLERAKKISEQFIDCTVKASQRGHDLYLGRIPAKNKEMIDVAAISTGMGAPSTDIILHELCLLGARRFLRIGTAGSIQHHLVKAGDIVIATAAVRDESTSANYITRDFPAIASLEIVNAAITATHDLQLDKNTHVGIVHSKDALYAREMGCSFLHENNEYMLYLKQAGVLASEMECSLIFTQALLKGYESSQHFMEPQNKILAGAILAIIGDEVPMSGEKDSNVAIDRAIAVGFETFKNLYLLECKNVVA